MPPLFWKTFRLTITRPAGSPLLFEKKLVDIVVTDLHMDGMDGLQLLEQVRANYPGIEVIIMTAYATQKRRWMRLKIEHTST
jgi:CheY-like chemotaxis protein